jgi:rod shape-determining protein MreD
MNLDIKTRRRVILTSTFVMAFILSIMPVPSWAQPLRPDWVGLVLIYWCLALPQYVGIGTGWTVGLILDVLYGSLLGEQALAKTIIAFLTVKMHLQVRMFPRWQQAVTVFVLIGISHLVILWIKSATGYRFENWTYWLSSIVSMLLWPWLFVMLRNMRRRANIN